MASGNAIRGSRVGAGPMGEAERGDTAPRFRVSYWCANKHETTPSFSEEAGVQPPETWDCPRCGAPSRRPGGSCRARCGAGRAVCPGPARPGSRSDADGQAILDEALASLRARKIIR